MTDAQPQANLQLRNSDRIEAIRHAFHYYGYEGGYEPGSFTTKLMSAVAHADTANRSKLWRVFPDLVGVMAMIMDTPNAEEELRRELQRLEHGPSN